MTFLRTDSGITNVHLFYDARFIVYVEEEPDIDPARSVDVPFWSILLRSIFVGASFHCKGLGGKSHVIDMANQVISNAIPNTFCAMDLDYDEIFGELMTDERIFYTFGYGVENDLFCPTRVPAIVRSILAGHPDVDEISLQVATSIEDTIKLEALCLLSDKLARTRSSSTLNFDSPQGNLDNDRGRLPVRFRRKPIREAIKSCRSKERTRLRTH